MKKIALDSNLVIAFVKGEERAVDLISKFTAFYLPITVVGELLYGSINSSKRKQNERILMRFIKGCKILNTTNLTASHYANIRLQLKSMGRPIPENDIWIAALCKENKLGLATFDKHFEFVVGLKTMG